MKPMQKPLLRPGLRANMAQGKSPAERGEDKVGDVRDIMHQGKGKTAESPAGKLRRIMGQ